MMNNQERYQAAFRGVHAPEGAAERALTRPKTPAASFSPKRRLPARAALIAAVIAALLVGSAGAEVYHGSVSNLLAPLYGGAQTEIVDGIGVPVDASVTVNGYTLAADAVIGDRYRMNIVYTLTRDDGAPIPLGARFLDHDNSAARGTGGGSVSWERDSEDPGKVHIVESWAGAAPLWKYAEITFRDLVIDGAEDHTYHTLAAGEWKLGFPLRYKDSTVKVPLNNLTVTGTEGLVYELRDLQVSSVGLYIDLIAPNNIVKVENAPSLPDGGGIQIGDAFYRSDRMLKDFQLSLRLTDGTIVTPNSSGAGGGGDLDAPTIKAHYECGFDVPIPLSDMEALLICDTEIPLDLH